MQATAGRSIAAALSLVLVAEIAPTEAAVAAVPPARIPVTEPVRVKRQHPKPPTSRPTAAPAIRPSNPVPLAGPPMVRPRDLDAVVAAARRRNLSPSESSKPNLRVSQPRLAPSIGTAHGGVRRAQSLPSDPTGSGTGINHWWRYEEQSLPGGGGHMMVNVGTGNLLVQQDDMSVPHKGIELAFRRTYNSQSPPTFSGDLQTYTSMYGNGWTNTFDAHVIRTSPGHFSVFDIDGARYDFTPSGTPGVVIGPPGQPTKLEWDGACGLKWTRKSGTVYYFYNVNSTQASCPAIGTMGGYAGKLYQIIGRNRNTYITFSYAWDNGDASVNGKVSTITATTESGMSATLNFADVSGRRLLQTLTQPDGTGVRYFYDANGNMVNVIRPPNNAAGNTPILSFGYTTIGNDQILFYYSSPRWCSNSIGCGYDGAWVLFLFNGTSAATSTFAEYSYSATLNPTINDGTNTPLYPGYQPAGLNYSNLRTEYYTTGVTTPTYRDTDGHMTNWVVDGLGRPTQTQECTASANQGQQCTGTWLTTGESWDADNNLVATVEPRGYEANASPQDFETDRAYDAKGNVIAVALPRPAAGTFRPTSLFSYGVDATGSLTNNVVAYCGPIATHRIGGDWQAPPAVSDSLCPSTLVATQFVYSYPTSQPNGRLDQRISPATSAAPNGYHTNYSYGLAQQGGADYGLPTQIQGDPISQPDASTPSRQPTENIWYDLNGNIQCYQTGSAYWLFAYDALGRLKSAADPDDGLVSSSTCTKGGGQPGWDTSTVFSYYADGSKASVQTPPQRALGVSTQIAYDLDGNQTIETHATSCMAAPCTLVATTSTYDGADRLVEVALPYGAGDAWQSPWLTRYVYDISQGGTVSMPGATFSAYGNLATTQEYLPVDASHGPWSWQALKGTAYDALDRAVADYGFSPGSAVANTTALRYDSPGQAGLLSSTIDPLQEKTLYSYDNLGRTTAVQFQNATSPTYSKQYAFDADGNAISETSGLFGTQTLQYDWNGSLLSRSIPAYGPVPATTLNYDYYSDGRPKDLRVNVAPLSQAAPIETWTYRSDGIPASTILQLANNSYTLTTSYTNAGRLQATNDITGSTSYAYDSTGQEVSRTFPAGSFTNERHDAEGLLASYTGYQNYFPPAGTNVNNVLTVRGELLTRTYSPDFAYDHTPLTPSRNPVAAHGYIDSFIPYIDPSHPGIDKWDVRTKMPLSQWGDPGNTGQDYSYDAAGRLVSAHDGWSGYAQNSGDWIDHTGSYTKSYDAENHLVGQSLSSYYLQGVKYLCPGDWFPSPPPPSWASTTTASLSYSWNVDGHPWVVNGYGVIWNGDEPLMTINGGAIASIRIGTRAVLTPNASNNNVLTVIDRDMSGEAVSSRNITGYTGMSLPGVYATNCSSPSPGGTMTGAASNGVGDGIAQPRSDGIWDGVNMIQGVRNYDVAVGQWTTPDAYGGDVGDPVSQNAYTWNRNNPYLYSDPSGLYPCGPTARISGEVIAADMRLSAIGCVSQPPRNKPDTGSTKPTPQQAAAELEHANVLLSRNPQDFGPNSVAILSMAGGGGGGAAAGSLLRKAGYKWLPHFIKRLAQRLRQGRISSEADVLKALKDGVPYWDPSSGNYVFRDPGTGIDVVTSSLNRDPASTVLISVFQGKNPSARWIQLPWTGP
jgi:YD repeat-containing protein